MNNNKEWAPGDCRNRLAHIENAIDRAFPEAGKIDRYDFAYKFDWIKNEAEAEFAACTTHS